MNGKGQDVKDRTAAGEEAKGPPPVFVVINDAKCDDCGTGIVSGDFLFKDGPKALCMECADLDHLYFLPRGDAALTRRATKYSTLTAVVLKWSRARKRDERQGILVEEAALVQAETECVLDADSRARRQSRESEKRAVLDVKYVEQFRAEILRMFPGCPDDAAKAISEHACAKYSGRVGRSAAAKDFDPDAIILAVRAHIRHLHTKYDMLLAGGWGRREAREEVAGRIENVVREWKRSPSMERTA